MGDGGMMGDDGGGGDDDDEQQNLGWGFERIEEARTIEGSAIIIRQAFSWRSKYTSSKQTESEGTQAHPSSILVRRGSQLSTMPSKLSIPRNAPDMRACPDVNMSHHKAPQNKLYSSFRPPIPEQNNYYTTPMPRH